MLWALGSSNATLGRMVEKQAAPAICEKGLNVTISNKKTNAIGNRCAVGGDADLPTIGTSEENRGVVRDLLAG
jgi:hypothetical protein